MTTDFLLQQCIKLVKGDEILGLSDFHLTQRKKLSPKVPHRCIDQLRYKIYKNSIYLSKMACSHIKIQINIYSPYKNSLLHCSRENIKKHSKNKFGTVSGWESSGAPGKNDNEQRLRSRGFFFHFLKPPNTSGSYENKVFNPV